MGVRVSVMVVYHARTVVLDAQIHVREVAVQAVQEPVEMDVQQLV